MAEAAIYLIANVVNGKRYVGQTRQPNKRWSNHRGLVRRGSMTRLHRAMRKWGDVFFTFTILERCDPEQLNDRERELIRVYQSKIPHGYNICDGGDGAVGRVESQESNRKRSLALKGRPRGVDLERNKKIAQTLRGRKPPEASIIALRARRGEKRTDETRAKMRAKALAREARKREKSNG